MATVELNRRSFLGLAGSGLFVFFHAELVRGQEPARLPGRMPYPTDFNAYLRIGEDGRVTCLAGKVELGQGVTTSLAQVLAEELDVDFDAVDVILGDTGQCPWDMGTFGSMTTPLLVPVVRRAGAEARSVLLAMAAERWKASAGTLQVRSGVIRDPANAANVITYAQLVEGKRIERHLENVPVKPVRQFQVIGRSQHRKDALEKITGKAKYAGDQVLPGMLHAKLLRPPAHGASLESVDTSEAEKVPGVRVIQQDGMVAVLHERPDVAADALSLVKSLFERPPDGPDDVSIFDHIVKTAPQPSVAGEAGNLAEGEKLAETTFEETYRNSYISHSPIETHSATAVFEDGKVTVWASTQAPFSVKNAVAGALGIAADNVRIISRYVGGGFGGKTEADQAVEAARLATITGKPVQVVWSRQEEFFYDRFMPAAFTKIRSGINGEGKIVLWDVQVYGAGDREARPFYDIPNLRAVSAGGWSRGNPPGMNPFEVGAWRGPSVNSNTFARESHIDTMAAKAGIDPVEFRLKNLTDPRMRRVLETAASRFGWKPGRAPSGRGAGVACGIYSNGYNTTMAEVSVDKSTGAVRVGRLVLALDVGVVLNPDGMRQQCEGCLTMGLGYALGEELKFRNGEVLVRSFSDYQLPRFSWLPEFEIVLVDNPELAAVGGGEPPIVAMGAVLANAIFDASGARVRQFPVTPERIRAALAGA